MDVVLYFSIAITGAFRTVRDTQKLLNKSFLNKQIHKCWQIPLMNCLLFAFILCLGRIRMVAEVAQIS